MSHTPGKWIAERVGVGSLGGPDDVEVDVYVVRAHAPVCEYVGENDARLIAAAPDLLEALKGMVSTWGDSTLPSVLAVNSAAKAAIAKAEGK